MAGFPLLDLNSSDFEKVVNKLKVKSYCRLQQTCHAVSEFILTCPNVALPIGGVYSLIWNEEKSRVEISSIGFRGRYPVESFYGLRLCFIDPDEDADVDALSQVIKKNKITCRDLALYNVEYSVEDCIKLLNTVNASKVILNSSGSDSFEAIFSSKYLKEVELKVEHEQDLKDMGPRILSRFSDVTVEVVNSENPYNFIRTVIDCILWKYSEKLEVFMCTMVWDEKMPTKNQLEKELAGYRVTAKPYDSLLEFDVELPENFEDASLTGRFTEYDEICITYYNNGR